MKTLISFFLFMLGIFSIGFSQNKNEIQLGFGKQRFFDWTVSTSNYYFSYSRIIKPRFVTHFDVAYAGQDLYWNGYHDEDFSSGDVYSRDDWFMDASVGYNVFNFCQNKLVIETFAGPSFVSGVDNSFDYIIDNSFGEVSVTGKYRNNFGCNLGVRLKYIPFPRMSISLNNKLHVFANSTDDYSIGLLVGILFGDPHFKKKRGL
ncbi:MAG: hypothetical protein ABI729_06215 [Chitinophagales bacterium]